MKTMQMWRDAIWRSAAVSLTVMVLASCTKESSPGDRPEEVRVKFTVPGIEQTVGTKANTEALAEGTTIRIAAFNSSAENPVSTTFHKEAVYVYRDGRLVPCRAEPGSGKFLDYNATEMSLPEGRFDFYAVTPAVQMNTDDWTVAVSNGMDYASSITKGAMVKPTGETALTLSIFKRKCAKVTLRIQPESGFSDLERVAVEQVVLSDLPAAASGVRIADGDISPANGSDQYTVGKELFTVDDPVQTSAAVYLLPCNSGSRTLDYTLRCSIAGYEYVTEIKGTIKNTRFESGRSYIVTLTLEKTFSPFDPASWITVTQSAELGGW